MARANYSIVASFPDRLVIRDVGPWNKHPTPWSSQFSNCASGCIARWGSGEVPARKTRERNRDRMHVARTQGDAEISSRARRHAGCRLSRYGEDRDLRELRRANGMVDHAGGQLDTDHEAGQRPFAAAPHRLSGRAAVSRGESPSQESSERPQAGTEEPILTWQEDGELINWIWNIEPMNAGSWR